MLQDEKAGVVIEEGSIGAEGKAATQLGMRRYLGTLLSEIQNVIFAAIQWLTLLVYKRKFVQLICDERGAWQVCLLSQSGWRYTIVSSPV